MVGATIGFAFPMWISIGAYIVEPPVTIPLPRSIEGCIGFVAENFTEAVTGMTETDDTV